MIAPGFVSCTIVISSPCHLIRNCIAFRTHASSLAEKRGEPRPRGGGRRARAGDDLLFGGGEMPGHGGCGAEMVEEAVADLGPECRARLLGAAPRPDAGPFECRAEACDIVPDLADPVAHSCRDGAHRH